MFHVYSSTSHMFCESDVSVVDKHCWQLVTVHCTGGLLPICPNSCTSLRSHLTGHNYTHTQGSDHVKSGRKSAVSLLKVSVKVRVWTTKFNMATQPFSKLDTATGFFLKFDRQHENLSDMGQGIS